MRILVAEDHPALGPNLKKGLESHHYAVDLVTTGDDALALGLAVPYDLIVLDVMLPEESMASKSVAVCAITNDGCHCCF